MSAGGELQVWRDSHGRPGIAASRPPRIQGRHRLIRRKIRMCRHSRNTCSGSAAHQARQSPMVDEYPSVERHRVARVYAKGALCGLAAVTIWAGWIVVARLGLRTSLAPEDITAIRFAVAGPILLPYLLRRGLALDRLGWRGVLLLAIGGGA